MVAAVVAVREGISAFESFLVYYPHCDSKNAKKILKIKESTYMVDGIGGGVWEGAIILSRLLEATKVGVRHNIIELGCGAGLSGIVAALNGARVLLTDRSVDLAEQNVAYSQLQFNPVRQLAQHSADNTAQDHSMLDIRVHELCWEANNSESLFFDKKDTVDILVGAEITCLRKQQHNLMKTIETLSGPKTIILLSFDDIPMNISESRIEDEKSSSQGKLLLKLEESIPATISVISKYEKEMNEMMRLAGFHRAIVCTANVEWHKEDAVDKNSEISEIPNTSNDFGLIDESKFQQSSFIPKKSFATVEDITLEHYNDLDNISFPQLPFGNGHFGSSLNIMNSERSSKPKSDASHHTHHITAYYRPSAVSVCSRCHKKFLLVLNKDVAGSDRPPGKACRHHGGFYVCRYHPAELRLSIDGGGDGMGYYGNGKEGWEAKFWDCCGDEDINAPGCKWESHLSY